MDDFILNIYYQTIKKVCGLDKGDITYKIIKSYKCSKKGYLLLIENDYGEEVLEYVDGNKYQSGKNKKFSLLNYDEDNDISQEIFNHFGYSTFNDSDVNLLSDVLENCLDWEFSENEDLKEEVVKHITNETNFFSSEVSYLFDEYMLVNPKDKLLMNTNKWLKDKIL